MAAATRRLTAVALTTATLWVSGCGGGDGSEGAAPPASDTPSLPSTTRAPIILPTAPTTPPVPPPEGVEEYPVVASHLPPETGFNYPQTPPAGGPHSPTWQTCAFYDRPVPSETAVHSLEHGAIWITYRPDVAPDEIQLLRELAARRADVLVSRWDTGLPTPFIATSWGRQIKLQTARDPRLDQFIRAFSGVAPEPGAPC